MSISTNDMYVPMEVREVLPQDGKGLSPSLRLTKFAPLRRKDSKKDAIDFLCAAEPESFKAVVNPAGAVSHVVTLQSRLIVNQAGGVLENAGLCIHRHFGYPYIPGSAVKGTARHAAWCAWRETEDEVAKLDLARKIGLTFGFPTGDGVPKKDIGRENSDAYLDGYLTQSRVPEWYDKNGKPIARAGAVSFLAAVPEGTAKLVTDVLCCHHMDYYSTGDKHKDYMKKSGGKALDNENPNPQFFPAVESGATFVFTIVPLRRPRGMDFDPLKFAWNWLKRGLEENGAGAKTSAGYGWFEYDERAEAQKLEQEAAERKRKAEQQKKQAEEEKRLADMDPLQREMEKIGRLDDQEFSGVLKTLDKEKRMVRLAVIRLMNGAKKEKWKNWKKLANKGKHIQRVELLKETATQLGEELS